jgi:hypothetical protein
MPLPLSFEREEIHHREIEMRGFRRSDGMFEVDAHLTDVRAHTIDIEDGRLVEAGQPLHDMSIRLVIDVEMTVMEVYASVDAAPFSVCPDASSAMQAIKGLRIGAGWSSKVRELLSGNQGCTHLRELLGPIGTVAFQTLYRVRQSLPESVDSIGKPKKIDSCYAYSSEGQLVLHRWPMYYRGPSLSTNESRNELK